MADAKDSTKLLVPRYLGVINAHAKQCGLEVGITEIPGMPHHDSWDNEGPFQAVVWTGSITSLRATGMFPASRRIASAKSFRGGRWRRGSLERAGRYFRATIISGFKPQDIEQRGSMEVVHYDEWTGYHGSKEDLSAAGVPKKALGLNKRTYIHYWGGSERDTQSRLLPDGSLFVMVENDASYKARIDRDKQNLQEREERRESGWGISQSSIKTREDYRAYCFKQLVTTGAILLTMLRGESLAFRFDKQIDEKVIDCFRDITDLIKESPIQENAAYVNKEQMRRISDAENDAGFQRFIGRFGFNGASGAAQ